MLPFFIQIFVDDDFGVPQFQTWGISNTVNTVKCITNIIPSDYSTVDPKLFEGKAFFKPIEKFLYQDKLISELDLKSFEKMMSQFGEYILDGDKMIFEKDNLYDLDYAYLDKNRCNKISIVYKNCPVNSFYLIEENNLIKILFSPFTKSYYTITETEWLKFVNCIERDLSLSETRDIKLNQILGESTNQHANIIRQLGFIVNNTRDSSHFLSSVYSYYKRNGFITDKQANCVKKSIW